METAQVGGIDGTDMLAQRGAEHAGIDQGGHVLEDAMLGDHVRCLVDGAGEHQLPVQRDRLALEAFSLVRPHSQCAGAAPVPHLSVSDMRRAPGP
jgi:hypothetical protein